MYFPEGHPNFSDLKPGIIEDLTVGFLIGCGVLPHPGAGGRDYGVKADNTHFNKPMREGMALAAELRGIISYGGNIQFKGEGYRLDPGTIGYKIAGRERTGMDVVQAGIGEAISNAPLSPFGDGTGAGSAGSNGGLAQLLGALSGGDAGAILAQMTGAGEGN